MFYISYISWLLILLRISINWIAFLPYLSLKFIRYFEVAQRSSFHNKFLIRGRLAFIFGTNRARASGLRKANVKKKWFTQRYLYNMHMIHMIWLLWYDIKILFLFNFIYHFVDHENIIFTSSIILLDINSHAGGWSQWRILAVKSILWEAISLNRLHIVLLLFSISFLHLLLKLKFLKRLCLPWKKFSRRPIYYIFHIAEN